MASPQTTHSRNNDADDLVERAISQVERWLQRAATLETREDRASMDQLGRLVQTSDDLRFVMQFVDRVARPDSAAVSARQMNELLTETGTPRFLGALDRWMLTVGARVARFAPRLVMTLAGRRMRSIVGKLVAPAEHDSLRSHLVRQTAAGYQTNVNLLGEAVLGEGEANRRLEELKALVALPEVNYVSVKITAVASRINHWAYEDSLQRLVGRLSELVDDAQSTPTPTFINFDMEEYHDLHLTIETFKAVLGDPDRLAVDAGIVVQAYLPDALDVLRDLAEWANARHRDGGGTIKIRLVKGANLAIEQVEAAMHGWEQAPYPSKLEADAGYRSCLDWLLQPANLTGVRVGVASHNLFDVAWAKLLAERRGVVDRIQFEMLQGMAPAQAKAVNADVAATGTPTLLYTPAVADDDFDVAIGYLFRRLEENAAPSNYLHQLFSLTPGSAAFHAQAEFFREGVALRTTVSRKPRRHQDRSHFRCGSSLADGFTNEPDTDPSLASNRDWIDETLQRTTSPAATPLTDDVAAVAAEHAIVAGAQPSWAARPPSERRKILYRFADELARRRSELLATMMHEARKTIAEGDVEISEAIDFARWYGDQCLQLEEIHGATFAPLGTIAVVPPWNFPTAIPAGGVLAALAAGNGVVLKPAPQTPRCAELVAQACWAAGVPQDVLRFVRTRDDAAGRALVESADGVILTGSIETADLFRSWKPDMKLFAETSGKNALIITPSADIDLAVADLVASAFGHAGQKCSAASLAILVGDLASSERFKRQLIDAVQSLRVGAASAPNTDVPPLIDGGNDRLNRAVGQLENAETWWVEPQRLGPDTISPGVRAGVEPASWFHTTECFGPVLGVMTASTLDEAIHIANSSEFGLTGGIHTLDPSEVKRWAEAIEVGNGYVNRPITGAIVQRQPFGGWKASSVGPGAKAGGPNYLLQLGTWTPEPTDDDFDATWATEFAKTHDPAALECEANIFRYRPLEALGVLYGAGASHVERRRIARVVELAGVRIEAAPPEASADVESRAAWLKSMGKRGIQRVRFIGLNPTPDDFKVATEQGLHLIAGPVTPSGRLEFLTVVREQSMTVTLHRFGNLTGAEELRATIAPNPVESA